VLTHILGHICHWSLLGEPVGVERYFLSCRSFQRATAPSIFSSSLVLQTMVSSAGLPHPWIRPALRILKKLYTNWPQRASELMGDF
jgi:hypothetical protein